jgi:hypothetical protein
MTRNSLIKVLVAVLAAAASGCYTFQPTSAEGIGPGQDVRVRVTGAFADSLGPLLMRDDARVIEGPIVAGDPTSVLMDVAVSSGLQGIRMETLNQRVEIPRNVMVDVETKELSKGRTYGLIAVAVAAGAAIAIAQLSGDSGGGNPPGGGGPVEAVIDAPSAPSGVSVPIGWLGALLRR